MSILRVCRLSDAVCTSGCGAGSCKSASNKYATASTATASTASGKLTLDGLEAAVQKLRGIPPVKWMLVAPDGRVWSDEDPMKLGYVCAQAKFGQFAAAQTKEGPTP